MLSKIFRESVDILVVKRIVHIKINWLVFLTANKIEFFLKTQKEIFHIV